jgi:hypothetical protein
MVKYCLLVYTGFRLCLFIVGFIKRGAISNLRFRIGQVNPVYQINNS